MTPQTKPHCYTDSRYLIFKAESTLFKLPIAVILARCTTFTDHVEIPSITDTEGLGTTDANPVMLIGVTSYEVTSFLDFLLPSLKPKRFFTKELEAILKLSVMYSALDGRAFAISELSSSKLSVAPAHLLNMSIKYHVPQWYKPSFTRLAQKPLHILSPVDLGLIPPHVLQELLLIRYNVDFGRRTTLRVKPAFYRERIASPSCMRDADCCVQGILVLWDTIVEPMLMDPVWMPARMIMNDVVAHLQTDHICSPCKALYHAKMLAVFQEEESIIHTALDTSFNKQNFASEA